MWSFLRLQSNDRKCSTFVLLCGGGVYGRFEKILPTVWHISKGQKGGEMGIFEAVDECDAKREKKRLGGPPPPLIIAVGNQDYVSLILRI